MNETGGGKALFPSGYAQRHTRGGIGIYGHPELVESIIDALDKTGQRDNTIVYTSNDRGTLGGTRPVAEERPAGPTTRVLLMVSGPGGPLWIGSPPSRRRRALLIRGVRGPLAMGQYASGICLRRISFRRQLHDFRSSFARASVTRDEPMLFHVAQAYRGLAKPPRG